MPDIRILLVIAVAVIGFPCLPYSFLDIFEEKLGLRPSRQRALRSGSWL